MTVIPVIDLLHGKAVHAVRGQRESYRPLATPLCRNGDVLTLVDNLVDSFACRTIYIADLDAIQGHGHHWSTLERINRAFPDLRLWFDGGFHGSTEIERAKRSAAFRAVVGTESWLEHGRLPDNAGILSIDIAADGLRDPSGVLTDLEHLPAELILMSLARVGADEGPDLDLLRHYRARTGDRQLYVAGGVRNRQDLQAARSAGASGVLLASALHNGRLTASDLAHFS